LGYRKHILVVDDNPSITAEVERGLLELDAAYEVTTANNGEECLENIRLKKPDLIILDIIMPGMDGWNIVEKLHETKEWKDIPIIFLTAKDDVLSKSVASMCIEEYLVKPVNIEELDKKIKKILHLPK